MLHKVEIAHQHSGSLFSNDRVQGLHEFHPSRLASLCVLKGTLCGQKVSPHPRKQAGLHDHLYPARLQQSLGDLLRSAGPFTAYMITCSYLSS